MQVRTVFDPSRNRFGWLTLAVFLVILARPLLEDLEGLEFMADLFFAGLFISGIYAAREGRRGIRVAAVLAGGSLVARIAGHFAASPVPGAIAEGLAALFFAHALWNILGYIRTAKRVTLDVIFASVCAYLLLGLIFADACFFLESARPGSFKLPDAGADRYQFVYYSFVTLTTLGYGDIVAAGKAARSLAILEAVLGQLYLAVLIGWLVGAYSAERRDGGE